MASRSPCCCSSERATRRASLRSAWLAGPALLALTLALGLAARPAPAKPALLVSEYVLEHAPERIAVVAWQGKPAVLVLSEPFGDAKKGELPLRRLALLRVRGGALKEIAAWRVPEELRWAEPMPGSGAGWFGLTGASWGLAEAKAPADSAALEWRALCDCASVFALGRTALQMETPFVTDLDGDGRLEVLLPAWNGLVVHALDSREMVLRPLWRDAWDAKEKFEEQDGKLEARLNFPGYLIQDVNRDGMLDLIQNRGGTLLVTQHPRHPPPPEGEYYAWDSDARLRLKRLDLPKPVLLAVLELEARAFDSRQAVEQALREAHPDAPAYLEAVLEATRSPLPVYFAQPTGLSVSDEAESESRKIVAIADMDGDRLPDALELHSTERGDPFNQKNQIRWYPGRLVDGAFRFGETAKTYFTEGLAFVELIRPSLRGNGEPSLFLATMEVNLMGLVRAVMLRKVTFEAYLYPWQNGALPQDAPLRGTFTFSVELAEQGTRPMLLMADLTGDGQREFLFNLEMDRLFAFSSKPDAKKLGDHPIADVAAPLPRKPEDVLVADLDGSGKEMLLLRYRGKQFSPKEQRTLRIVRLEERTP
jgi:hypothetical protein